VIDVLTVHVKVITAGNRRICLPVYAHEDPYMRPTLATLRSAIHDICSVPPHEQRIVFQGATLYDDDAPLRSYGVTNDSCLQLFVRCCGNGHNSASWLLRIEDARGQPSNASSQALVSADTHFTAVFGEFGTTSASRFSFDVPNLFKVRVECTGSLLENLY
jgi:hypothetical protein